MNTSKVLLAGMLVSGAAAGYCGAAMADTPPAICMNLSNHAAQVLAWEYTDGNWGDKHNPAHETINTDFTHFPVKSTTDLGSCEDENSGIPAAWCQVAGGSPEVYKIEYSQVDESSGEQGPAFAAITVTYNRGGCWVDDASLL